MIDYNADEHTKRYDDLQVFLDEGFKKLKIKNYDWRCQLDRIKQVLREKEKMKAGAAIYSATPTRKDEAQSLDPPVWKDGWLL